MVGRRAAPSGGAFRARPAGRGRGADGFAEAGPSGFEAGRPAAGRSLGVGRFAEAGPAGFEAGLSLVETIVALALAVVVGAGLFGIVRPALLLNQSLPAMADAQQRLRHAVDRLHADLMGAGRGTARVAPGPLRRMLPPIVPYRVGRWARDGEHRRVRPDAVTMLAVSAEGGAETRLLDAVTGSTAAVRLAPGPGCSRPGCGFRAGDLVLVFDRRPAWDVFRVRTAGAAGLTLEQVGPTAVGFEAGAAIAPLDVRHYYFDEERRQLRRYDGWRGNFPLVDGVAAVEFRYFGAGGVGAACAAGALNPPQAALEEIPLERFTDGPWCGPAAAPFDADLLRVRAIGFDVRVETAVSASPRLRAVDPDSRTAGSDYRVAVVVAPPNLAVTALAATP